MVVRIVLGSAWALIVGLAGGWLMLSPWALGQQPPGKGWTAATQADFFTGVGLVVLAVNYQQTSTSSMQGFLRKVNARFPAVFDPAGQIAGAYGVNVGLPVSVFIDRSGTVSFIQLGQMSDAVLQQHLHTIL